MRIVREVPISEITDAMMAFVDQDRDGPNQVFFEYASTQGVWREGSMTEDAMRAHLANLPECAASTAFASAANDALARAAADVPRPFDSVILDDPTEAATLADLEALTRQVEDASPLLAPVVDILTRCSLSTHAATCLGDAHAWLDAVTGDALMTGLPEDGYCDKHGEYCYEGSAAIPVPWEHVEYLAPGTRARIQAIADRLRVLLPPAAPDSAADRFSPAYLKASGRTR